MLRTAITCTLVALIALWASVDIAACNARNCRLLSAQESLLRVGVNDKQCGPGTANCPANTAPLDYCKQQNEDVGCGLAYCQECTGDVYIDCQAAKHKNCTESGSGQGACGNRKNSKCTWNGGQTGCTCDKNFMLELGKNCDKDNCK
jgi:hypothetical protein